MPFVKVLMNETFVKPADMVEFSSSVRDIVAKALTCEGGDLDPDEDIELLVLDFVRNFGDYSPCDITLSIEAMDYPDRVANKEQRGDQIRLGVEALVSKGDKVGVWLDLKPAYWTNT